jgi:hypothetical protein
MGVVVRIIVIQCIRAVVRVIRVVIEDGLTEAILKGQLVAGPSAASKNLDLVDDLSRHRERGPMITIQHSPGGKAKEVVATL